MNFYITGDPHGKFSSINYFRLAKALNENDCIIILGDAGLNYFLDERDTELKEYVNGFGCKIFSIRGNHDANPKKIKTYKLTQFCGGKVFFEERFPNLYFSKFGEVYNFNGTQTLVLDGAYSIDKYFRLRSEKIWFSDEQPTVQQRKRVEEKLNAINWTVDCVFSHTCPFKFEPQEFFLPFIDQTTVDKTMEHWLDSIEERLHYNRWYFGHFHGDKKINSKVKMLFHTIENFEKE